MKATIKDIEEEVKNIKEIYKEIYCKEDYLIEEINKKKLTIYDSLYEIILEMDSSLGTYSFIKPKKVFYWGLNEEERKELKQLCNSANCNNYFNVFCYAFDKYFDIFLQNNLKYNEMKYPNDFSDIKYLVNYIKDKVIQGHINAKYFYDTANRLYSKNYDKKPSVCAVVWAMLMGSAGMIKRYLELDKKNNIDYYDLTQEESDDLYCMCVKANKLGIDLFSNYDQNYKVNNIDSKLDELFDVIKEVYDQYFIILLNKNIECREKCYKQMNMLDEFARIHDMSEREIIDFVKIADSKGYSIIDCKTNEEIESLYKKLFPEA